MDYLIKQQLRTGSGSIGETAKVFAELYRSDFAKPLRNLGVFNFIFKKVIHKRIAVHILMGVNDQNFFQDLTKNSYETTEKFLDDYELQIQASMPPNQYVNNLMSHKLNLPTRILYAMLLESNNKRQGLAGASPSFTIEALKIVHQETEKVCPFQITYNEEDFVEENKQLCKMFLLEIDPSLKPLLKLSAT